jgi:hypothetical protein
LRNERSARCGQASQETTRRLRCVVVSWLSRQRSSEQMCHADEDVHPSLNLRRLDVENHACAKHAIERQEHHRQGPVESTQSTKNPNAIHLSILCQGDSTRGSVPRRSDVETHIGVVSGSSFANCREPSHADDINLGIMWTACPRVGEVSDSLLGNNKFSI